MAAPNINPIFSRVAEVQGVESIATANNTIDLTSCTSYLICTANATNGGWLDGVIVKINPANNCAGTVVRFWMNNGSTTGTSSNSFLIGEMTIAAWTTSATAQSPDYFWSYDGPMAPGAKLYLTVATAPGGSCELTAFPKLTAY